MEWVGIPWNIEGKEFGEMGIVNGFHQIVIGDRDMRGESWIGVRDVET